MQQRQSVGFTVVAVLVSFASSACDAPDNAPNTNTHADETPSTTEQGAKDAAGPAESASLGELASSSNPATPTSEAPTATATATGLDGGRGARPESDVEPVSVDSGTTGAEPESGDNESAGTESLGAESASDSTAQSDAAESEPTQAESVADSATDPELTEPELTEPESDLDPASVSLQEFADATIASLCAYTVRCLIGPAPQQPSVAECVARYEEILGPPELQSSARIEYDPEAGARCLQALNGSSCERDTLRACDDASTGTLTEGESCEFSGECQDGSCEKDDSCDGTCVPDVPLGGPCDDDSDCTGELVCAYDGMCQVPVGVGEPCDTESAACAVGNYCPIFEDEPRCLDLAGIYSKLEGEECGLGHGYCSAGLACARQSSVNETCLPIVAADQPCFAAVPSMCASGYCELVEDEYEGVCEALRPIGEACTTTAQCDDAHCDGTECVPYKHLGDTCTDSAECVSTGCLDGQCVPGAMCIPK